MALVKIYCLPIKKTEGDHNLNRLRHQISDHVCGFAFEDMDTLRDVSVFVAQDADPQFENCGVVVEVTGLETKEEYRMNKMVDTTLKQTLELVHGAISEYLQLLNPSADPAWIEVMATELSSSKTFHFRKPFVRS